MNKEEVEEEKREESSSFSLFFHFFFLSEETTTKMTDRSVACAYPQRRYAIDHRETESQLKGSLLQPTA